MPSTLFSAMLVSRILGRFTTAVGAVMGLSVMTVQIPALANPGLADGTYLFGEAAEANTIGSTYFVFKVQNQTLSGALYQPSSSFDCVRGQVVDGKLDLVITNAYDQTEHSYTMALTTNAAAVASQAGGSPTIQIQGLEPIDQLSELDHQLLQRCAAQ